MTTDGLKKLGESFGGVFRTEYYTIQNRILSRYEPVGNDRVYMLADHLGSIAAETDNRGTQIYRGWFTPYGAGATGTGEPGRFAWNGTYGYRDAAWTTGNHPSTMYLTAYVRARHYSRYQARRTTADPLYPSESAYGYAGGNPVGRFDASGENWSCIGCAGCLGAAALACYDCGLDGQCWVYFLSGIYENLPPIVTTLCENACFSCLGGLLRGIPKTKPPSACPPTTKPPVSKPPTKGSGRPKGDRPGKDPCTIAKNIKDAVCELPYSCNKARNC